MRCALVIAATCWPLALAAQDWPFVEIARAPGGPVAVGTPVLVTLTLLVPSYMPQPPIWPDMQLSDAITQPAPRASQPLTRRIGRASWAGLQHSYVVTPQRAADYVFPPATIGVTYADPAGGAPIRYDAPVPQIALSAIVPAGARGLDPYVAACSLRLTGGMDGPGEAAHPGASVTRSLVIQAQGTQGMLLPEVLDRLPVPQGLRAYPHLPQLQDGPDGARRVESVTYSVEMPGDYALAPIRLDWWNMELNRVESATLPEARFSVAAPPGWHPSLTAAETARHRRIMPLTGVAGMALVLAAVLLRQPMARRWRDWRARATRSEPALFRRLMRLVRAGAVPRLRPAVTAWLSTLGFSASPHPLEHALIAEERRRWGPAPAPPERAALIAALRDARIEATSDHARQADGLPELNPRAEV